MATKNLPLNLPLGRWLEWAEADLETARDAVVVFCALSCAPTQPS